MGAKFSTSVGNIWPTSSISHTTGDTTLPDEESNVCSDIGGAVKSVSTSTTLPTNDNTTETDGEPNVCTNIVFGTSNHNFLKYRHLKRISMDKQDTKYCSVTNIKIPSISFSSTSR